MQLEAIIFASDAPVSLARLREAFQNQYSKQQLQQYLQQLSVLQHGRSSNLSKQLKVIVFKCGQNTAT